MQRVPVEMHHLLPNGKDFTAAQVSANVAEMKESIAIEARLPIRDHTAEALAQRKREATTQSDMEIKAKFEEDAKKAADAEESENLELFKERLALAKQLKKAIVEVAESDAAAKVIWVLSKVVNRWPQFTVKLVWNCNCCFNNVA
jgi:NAD/NADP transhydrogenase alpha subunit